MLQAHSLLWHYFWVAPNLLLGCLGVLMWRRGLRTLFPSFVAFALLVPVEQLIVYVADISPRVTPENFWRIFLAGLVIEGFLKIVLIAELFGSVFGTYASVASLGKSIVRAVGVVLVFTAVISAAYAPRDNTNWLISGAHLLEQTVYVIECGLLLFIFVFAAHFRLTWKTAPFGIALGMSISACVHLGTWAVMANGGLIEKRYLLDLVNMATYHVCVLIWFYYLLIPHKNRTNSTPPLPEHNLEVWNRELERLLQP